MPFHSGVIFRFQLLVFREVSNFSGSQHQTLSSYQTIIIPTDLNKLNRKKEAKKTQFLTSKTSFQCFKRFLSPPKLFSLFPKKKNTENLTHPVAFHCPDCAGGKLHIPKNPFGQFVLLGSFLHPFFGWAKFSAGSL